MSYESTAQSQRQCDKDLVRLLTKTSARRRFVKLEGIIVDRLKKIHSLINKEAQWKRSSLDCSIVGGTNRKDAIQRRANIREEMRQLEYGWEELNILYMTEARKRKSKFTQEQLDTQQNSVQKLYLEVEKLKEKYTKYSIETERRTGNNSAVAKINAQVLTIAGFDTTNDPSTSSRGAIWPSSRGGVEMTQQQAQRLEQINKCDEELNIALDRIAEAIDDLNDIAMMQQEEIKKQNTVLSHVSGKIGKTYDHTVTVNTKMNTLL
jgi:hypothetical protein